MRGASHVPGANSHESARLNDSSCGWNAPDTTTPVWIVKVLPRNPVGMVHATGKAPAPRPPGGSLSLTLTTGALLRAPRHLAAVTVTS